jgi:hypothetical protein
MAPHHIRHHNVRRQAVANDGNLVWSRHARVWVRSEVGHDLFMATRFLGRVLQNFDACVCF